MASMPFCQASSTTPATETPRPNKRPLPSSASPSGDVDLENRRKDPKISRACDVCKRKKIRCNGTLPCANCVKRSIHCAYNASYGRGRPPTPPLSFGVDEQQIRPVKDKVVNSLTEQDPGSLAENDFSSHNCSSASPELDIEAYVDPSSGLNFLHRAWKRLLMQKDDISLNESSGLERRQLLTSAGDRPFQVDMTALNTSFIPDAVTARKLQEFYFNTCVVTYCILHRPTVEKWMEVFLKNDEEHRPITHSLGPTRTAILLAMMAIAAFRHEVVNKEVPGANEAVALRKSDQLFYTAMELTDRETGFPRLESAQARLIQVIYLLQTSRMNKGWYTLGKTFQITLSLGMHRRRDQKRDLPFSERGRQNYITTECLKRTFWVAYIIDRYLSVVFGRPQFYQDEDIDQHFPDSVNDEDMTAQGRSISDDSGDSYVDALIYHAKIARIIGKISRAVYAVNDMSDYDRQAAASRIGLELQEWRASLPPFLGAVKPSTLLPSFRRQAIALQLAYSHAIVHVNRPFILNNEFPENVEKCISAAQDILKLVDKMAGDSLLFHSFWWTHYVTFCALAVVYVCEIQNTRHCTNRIDDFSFNKVLDLAEKCQGHLKRAATGLSQNHRYTIILGELRNEAQGCRFTRENGLSSLQGFDPELIANPEPNTHPLHDTEMNSIPDNEFCLRDGVISNTLDTFIFSDWLTLDSSAFFPLTDPESASPLSFTVLS